MAASLGRLAASTFQGELMSVKLNAPAAGPSASSTDLKDPRLVKALEQYMEAAETGQPPERQEFLARHADIAVPLALCLDGLNALHSPPGADSGDGSTPAAGLAAEMPLGDYHLLRELGRGGMGIVYEAEQLSLGRHVALKVLPFAATLDPRHLQRFHNEARAAACLHHTNIVPVHAVGCERGVHYYAMQFIEGQSLEAVLREQRRAQKPAPASASRSALARSASERGATIDQQPAGAGSAIAIPRSETACEPRGQASTLPSQGDAAHYFRRVAELTMQAAEALEHAHQSGVVHRDIKPANLLLDQRGSLWITDFGLAQFKSDAHLTMTGDLVGTLRYMSPEQALAQRVIVDHRTDIYSLGATLYELLTLRPAFRGRDRQELLRQIAFEDPVAPRRVNRAIPVELETIAVKAMEKNPADRYSTAKELAEDLQRFLKDEPTLARRPTLWRRLRKWSLRHRAAVRAATVALVVVLASVTGLAGAWLSDRAIRGAETQRAVNAMLVDAELLQKERNVPAALAKVKQAETILSSGVPTQTLKKSVQDRITDLKLVARLEEIKAQLAANVVMPNFGKLSFDFAQADRSYAEAFRAFGIDVIALPQDEAGRRISQTTVAVELAAALDEWSGFVKLAQLNDKTRWKQLLAVARNADPDPLRSRLRQALEQENFKALKDLAASMRGEDLPAATAVQFAVALQIGGANDKAELLLRQAQWRHTTDFVLNMCLASALFNSQPHQYEESLRFCTVALTLRPENPAVYVFLGSCFQRLGRNMEAIAAFEAALRIKPDFGSGSVRDALVATLEKKGVTDEIRNKYKDAIKGAAHTASWHYSRAGTLRNEWKTAEAIESLKIALEIDPAYVPAHNYLAWLLLSAEDLSLRDPKQALFHAEKGLSKNPTPPENNTVGVAYYRIGRFKEAVDTLSEVARLRNDICKDTYFFLAMALWQLGDKNEARDWFDKGVQWVQEKEPQMAPFMRREHRLWWTEAAVLMGMEPPTVIGIAPASPGKFTSVDLQPRANQKLNDNFGTEGNNLVEVGKDPRTFDGVNFNLGPGIIQLGSNALKSKPAKVEGIQVGNKCGKIHILHATQFGTRGTMQLVEDGTTIAQYQVRYEDGSTVSIPIAYGEDVRDWWFTENTKGVTRGKVVWQGENEYSKSLGYQIRLYLNTWENPSPDKKIAGIDYVKIGDTPAAPFCVAITLEAKDVK
jgi:serine/threonine protein kinase/Flp pilus assembly protein TadD